MYPYTATQQYQEVGQYNGAGQYVTNTQYPTTARFTPQQFVSPTQYQSANYGFGGGQVHRGSNPPFPNYSQYQQGNVQQTYSNYGRAQQQNGGFY